MWFYDKICEHQQKFNKHTETPNPKISHIDEDNIFKSIFFNFIFKGTVDNKHRIR